jgi:hypothetical protein
MKTKAFHGTTRDNAERILKGQCKVEPTWSVSDDDNLYLWCPIAFIEGEYPEAEDIEEAEEMAIIHAFESAQITAAMSDEPQKELVVLCFEFDSEKIERDESCENMELARCISDFEGIEENHTSTFIAKHNSRLDALVISGLLENQHIAKWRLDDDLIEAAEAMKDAYLESMSDFEWTEESQ